MPGRPGTGRLQFDPTSQAPRRQAVQQGGKLRRSLGINFFSGRRLELKHRVVKLLAIHAQYGLDGGVSAAIRTAGYAGAITAFGTFEEIRAAHKSFANSQLGA